MSKRETNDSQDYYPKVKKDSVQQFLIKTYNIVDDPQSDDIICWSKNGQSIIIKDMQLFTEIIIPKNFKHDKFSSFMRQLNLYSFHKKVNFEGQTEIVHQWFRRGQRDLLIKIQRKSQQKSKNNLKIQEKSDDLIQQQSDLTDDLKEDSTKLQLLKQRQEDQITQTEDDIEIQNPQQNEQFSQIQSIIEELYLISKNDRMTKVSRDNQQKYMKDLIEQAYQISFCDDFKKLNKLKQPQTKTMKLKKEVKQESEKEVTSGDKVKNNNNNKNTNINNNNTQTNEKQYSQSTQQQENQQPLKIVQPMYPQSPIQFSDNLAQQFQQYHAQIQENNQNQRYVLTNNNSLGNSSSSIINNFNHSKALEPLSNYNYFLQSQNINQFHPSEIQQFQQQHMNNSFFQQQHQNLLIAHQQQQYSNSQNV